MSPASDTNLLERYAATGDGEAFQQFVGRFAGMVHAAAWRQVGNAVLAEEVAQVVFTLAAGKARALSRHGALAAWLHRATRLESLKVLRAERRRRSRETTAFFMNTPDAHDVAAPDWEALHPLLDEAMNALKEKDREALLLRFFKGSTYREVGAALAVHEDAAKMQVARALEKLRPLLARRGIRSTTAALVTVLSGQARAASLSGDAVISLTRHAMAASAAPSLLTNIISIVMHAKGLTVGLMMGLAAGGVWLGMPLLAGPPVLPAVAARQLLSPTAKPAGLGSSIGPSARPSKRGVAEVFAGLRRLLTQPDTETNRLDVRLLLAELGSVDLHALTDLIEKELNADARRRLMPEVARIWAGIDPVAAMARLIACSSPPYQAGGAALTKSVFSVWHGEDPGAAQRWLVDHQDQAAFQSTIPDYISMVAQGLLDSSEKAAVDWAGKLEGADYRKAALRPMFDRYLKKDHKENCANDLARLFQVIGNCGESSMARLGIDELAAGWARYRGGEWDRFLETLTPGHLAWQAALAGISNSDVIEVKDGREMGMHTPQSRKSQLDRLSGALRLAGNRTTGEAVSGVLSRSGVVSKEVREWALPLLTGPERAPSIALAARKAMHYRGEYSEGHSPPEMALDWSREHPDPAVRDPLIYGLYRKWLQDQRDAAQQFRGRRDWPEELRSVLTRAEADL